MFYLFYLRATGREVFDWILDQGYYSERDTSNVMRQVLEAVAYLHSLHIVHRNLKVIYTSILWSPHRITLQHFNRCLTSSHFIKVHKVVS